MDSCLFTYPRGERSSHPHLLMDQIPVEYQGPLPSLGTGSPQPRGSSAKALPHRHCTFDTLWQRWWATTGKGVPCAALCNQKQDPRLTWSHRSELVHLTLAVQMTLPKIYCLFSNPCTLLAWYHKIFKLMCILCLWCTGKPVRKVWLQDGKICSFTLICTPSVSK